MQAQRVITGFATRPRPAEVVNGDAWTIEWHEDACRIAVIDGLGHGSPAAEASAAAIQALRARPSLGPVDAVQACHVALSGTRGAVAGIAAIDASLARLTYAGAGNIDVRICQAGREQRLASQRGTVGAVLPRLRAVEVALEAEWTLILHTDGVSDRFSLNDLPDVMTGDPQALAEAILLRWGRQTDDALVVVARPRSA